MRSIQKQTRAEIAEIAKSQQQIKWFEAIQENAGDIPSISARIDTAQLYADAARALAAGALTDRPINNLVFVDTVSKLPAPSGGVITLADNVTYFVTVNLDLQGSRLVAGRNTTILGGSSENCSITSTGLGAGVPLVTSAWSLPMRGITLTSGTAIALDAAGNPAQALDWFGVNFLNCTNIGRIANYSNVIWTDCAILSSANLVFDGAIGTVGFSQSIFSGVAGQTTIAVLPTATITRRFRAIYCAAIAFGGGTAFNVDVAASIPTEGYILDTVNFSGGGIYTAGVQYNDNKALFIECRGVSNSASISNYFMVGNATATVIAATTTPVKVAGTTTSVAITQKFTNTNNRATYTGAITRDFKVTFGATAASGNNNQVAFYVYRNGVVVASSRAEVTTSGTGRAENVFGQTIVQMGQNDYVEIYVENNSAITNITVEDLNVIVEALN